MTLLVALRGAAVTFGGVPLFSQLDLALSTGDRACIVGRNGSGKSTLLKLLAGEADLDAGERFVQPGTSIAYLAQEPDLSGYADLAAFVRSGLVRAGAEEDWRIAAAFDAVGLSAALDPRSVSGGEARRAALARAIVARPDVLLLDEPTNHLDLPAIDWLEGVAKGWRGAVLTVSHDRRFLEAVTTRTWWLDRGTLRRMDGPFAGFEEWAETVLAQEEAERARLDKRIAAETLWSRQGISARRKRNQGRLRSLYAMRDERRAQRDQVGLAKLDIADGTRGGQRVIAAEHIAKSYGERMVIRDFSIRVMRGDRVGILGPNGAGKTTLVRMLIGLLPPDAGRVTLGAGIVPVYFDQTRAALDPDATVTSVLLPFGGDHVQVGDRQRHIASYLADFLFDPSQRLSPVKALSGGERNRLLLAKLFAAPGNLLVLDEPTNDLDMETLDLLQDVLGDYDGTILTVSHDRDFLDRLATSIVAVEGDGSATEYVGGYTDYRRQRPAAEAASARPRAGAVPRPVTRASAPSSKLGYKDRRALDQLPERIAALEAEIAAVTTALADPGLYARDAASFAARSARLATLEAEKAAAEDRWLDLAMRAEGAD
jgi:ATP-binding cassette subfamily F protein uup